jgi:dynein heavy chain 1
MKEFPIGELLGSTNLTQINDSVVSIFNHLNKKLKIAPYPIARALPFGIHLFIIVSAISQDLLVQIKTVVGSRLFTLDYLSFNSTVCNCEKVFKSWDENVKEFINVVREITRKRTERFIPVKVSSAHTELRDRILFVHDFRKNHQVLVNTIERVLGGESKSGGYHGWVGLANSGALESVKAAIEPLNLLDILDVSSEGTRLWQLNENDYNEKISRVEQLIISRLKEQLETCSNASDMFRCFSKFNALFIRPNIRAAIHDYQTLLIDRVKDDIKKLHTKFKSQDHSSTVISARDIPPFSSSVIWAKQINRQLALYMKRVEAVLGRGWEKYTEGQKLFQEDSSFRKQLDTSHMFNVWLKEVQKLNTGIKGFIFTFTKERGIIQLSVNYDSKLISLFKEVRNLLHLSFQIPHSIICLAKDAQRIYPYFNVTYCVGLL